MRLQIGVGHAPVLDAQLRIGEALAVALFHMRAQDEIRRLEAVGLAVPVHAGAADAGTGEERLPAPHRQGGLAGIVAEGHRFPGVVLHQRLAHGEAQLVVHIGALEVRHGVARVAALQAHHLETAGGQFLGDDGADEADAEHHHVHFLEPLCHEALPLWRAWIAASTASLECPAPDAYAPSAARRRGSSVRA